MAQPHSAQPQPDPEVAAALQRMGLSSDDLLAAVEDANAEALECTKNDVVSRAGFIRWSSPLRRLGDDYADKGFTRERPRNFELLVSPDRTFAVTVAPGDHNTGTDKMPSTRIDRGRLTGQAVVGNRHQLGFDSISSEFEQTDRYAGTTIWLLLTYFDEAAEELRLELSVPVEFVPKPTGKRGHVVAFEPRLKLPSIALAAVADIEHEDEDDGGQIDVPVARRSGA